MKKQVSWSKYQDVLENLGKLPEGLQEELAEDGDGQEVAQYLEEEKFVHKGDAIITPMGVLPITEGVLASHNFDFWIMHTNFDITKEVAEKASDVKGVETFEVMTRYRARIGFPIGEMVENGNRKRMFDSLQVKQEIERVLLSCDEICNPEIDQSILDLYNEEVFEKFLEVKNKGYAEFDYWAAIILPNGAVEHTMTDSFDDFNKKHILYEQISQMTGGMFICHQAYQNSEC